MIVEASQFKNEIRTHEGIEKKTCPSSSILFKFYGYCSILSASNVLKGVSMNETSFRQKVKEKEKLLQGKSKVKNFQVH